MYAFRLLIALFALDAPTAEIQTHQLVAPRPAISHPFEAVKELPPLERREQIDASLIFILSMESSPALRTDDDRAVFDLVREYVATTSMQLTFIKEPHIQRFGKTVRMNMGYSCLEDVFIATPTQASPPFLAMLLYHEIFHAVHCRETMRAHGFKSHSEMLPVLLKRNTCESEALAYAAQSRFFQALLEAGRLPKVVSADPKNGDSGQFTESIEVWSALRHDRFCDWYEKSASGSESDGTVKIIGDK